MALRRSALNLAAAAGLALSAALTAPAVAAAPATPAAPTTAAARTATVDIEDQSGSYVYGTLTWSNRAVGFQGVLIAKGCRRAWFSTYDASDNPLAARSTSTHCNTADSIPPFSIPANVVGGAAYVRVCLEDEYAVPTTGCQVYFPS
ncbi:hypothetical protein [Streptomyces sp. NPDC050564]|uniref:hypothetical protein n=1 Tax=Streptomyces sp. NPDC050564 TaxID=3365631 RepID=UPI00379C9620